jgi:hypothetical protein
MDGRTGAVPAGAAWSLAGAGGGGPGGLRPVPGGARPAPVRGTGAGARRPGEGAWPLYSGLGPLAALPTAPGVARAFTAMVLSGWGMAAMTDTGTLIVSELASNVARAAEGPGGSPVYDDEGRMPVLWLRLMADPAMLGIEVWDSLPPQSGIPVPRDAGPDAESGRGLGIVAALSVDWGWEPVPARRIKRTWAVVAIS